MEPANFVALSKPFKEPLLLNDLPMMNITPDLDADRVVPVTITNPRKSHVLKLTGLCYCFVLKNMPENKAHYSKTSTDGQLP